MRLPITLLYLAIALTSIADGVHTFRKGESYADLSKYYGIPEDSIRGANPGIAPTTGLEVDIPCDMLLVDISDTDLLQYLGKRPGNDEKKGESYYQKAMDNLKGMEKARKKNNQKKIAEINAKAKANFLRACDYGYSSAFFQLGLYGMYGKFSEGGVRTPMFTTPLNDNYDEFVTGLRYLQVAVLKGERKALMDLAIAVGHEDSPIRNASICLSLLEFYEQKYSLNVNHLICYMYENGYGVPKNYIEAYIRNDNKKIYSSYTTSRERIIDTVDTLSSSFENAKYGAGLDSEMLFAIGIYELKEAQNKDKALFWFHRAAKKDNADANWMISSLIYNEEVNFGSSYSKEEQFLYFAHRASSLGNTEAADFVKEYEDYLEQKLEYERQKRYEEERRKQERTEKWIRFGLEVLNVAAQTYVAVEQQKAQARYQAEYAPKTYYSDMSDAQFAARNQLALSQIFQYTANKGIADWTGTPMVPTDMSAVDLGTDMTPGSPLWQWNIQQRINTISTQNARMRWENLNFYRQQRMNIEAAFMANPTADLGGCFTSDGFYFRGDGGNVDYSSSTPTYENTSTNGGYQYEQRYGDKDCPSCHGSGRCQYCGGDGLSKNFGASGQHKCPNCSHSAGPGSCGTCHGRGTVYGLK